MQALLSVALSTFETLEILLSCLCARGGLLYTWPISVIIPFPVFILFPSLLTHADCALNMGGVCTVIQLYTILSSRLPVTVVRGYSWQYADEDGGSGRTGLITSLDNFNASQWVLVEWSCGTRGLYRVGAELLYDLCIASGELYMYM